MGERKKKLGKHGKSKRDLIEAICESEGLYKYQVRAILIAIVQYIVTELCAGREVYILSLGKFWLKRFGKTKIVIPSTGKPQLIPERSIPKFTYARRIREFILKETRKNKRT